MIRALPISPEQAAYLRAAIDVASRVTVLRAELEKALLEQNNVGVIFTSIARGHGLTVCEFADLGGTAKKPTLLVVVPG